MPKCVGGITCTKHMHAQFWVVQNDLRHPCYSFLLYGCARAALVYTKKKPEKKRSPRNEKLKAKRASETEEQRKERLRIRREEDRLSYFQWLQRFRQQLMFIIITLCTFCNSLHVGDLSCSLIS